MYGSMIKMPWNTFLIKCKNSLYIVTFDILFHFLYYSFLRPLGFHAVN